MGKKEWIVDGCHITIENQLCTNIYYYYIICIISITALTHVYIESMDVCVSPSDITVIAPKAAIIIIRQHALLLMKMMIMMMIGE